MLLNHWDKPEKEELKQQLREQLKQIKFGSVGYLINIAKKNGYNPPTGRSRNNIKAKPTSTLLPKLSSPTEGSNQLTEIIQSFFQSGRNVFVNVSTGAGKSASVLNILAQEIPSNKKILFLVPTHKLADELINKFAVARKNAIEILKLPKIEANKTPFENLKVRSSNSLALKEKSDIVHFYGQKDLCEFTQAQEAFGDTNIPWGFCSKICPMNEGCQHIEHLTIELVISV
jgi:hypothetical protein